jgi:hypothetical protein
MKISILTLNESNEYLAIGNGSLGNWAKWPQAEELRDEHFDVRATKEFRLELKKVVKKANRLVGSQLIQK